MKANEVIPSLELEIIAIKDGKYYISYMSYSEWLYFSKNNKKVGFSYIAYQKGFSQYKLENSTK